MGRKKRTWPEVPAPLAAPVMDNHTHLPVHSGEIPIPDHEYGMREILSLFDVKGPALAEAGVVAVGHRPGPARVRWCSRRIAIRTFRKHWTSMTV